jgi:hypothetical protein
VQAIATTTTTTTTEMEYTALYTELKEMEADKTLYIMS